ncbi:MAG TPA: polysaccharide deacetylase family protein [Steroidobacteraceae bacterium]|nr:polysaccharide deacetylase family protein [Steroidobacteraceae bacterium]
MKRGIGAAFGAALLFWGLGISGLSVPARAAAAEPVLKIALTFDDLPINGTQPAGITQTQMARDTLAVLRKYRIPASYGFINAQKLENDPDGAEALRLWVQAGHPLANHTYTHLDLDKNTADDFTREILRNEPALELLMLLDGKMSGKHDFRWLRYPYLHEGDTLEKRRAVRAFLAAHRYQVAETTLDYEDYLWNSAYARCLDRKDAASIARLRESYIATADEWMRAEREMSRQVYGRDINHVLLLHQGAFSATILPDLFALLKKRGYRIVTLEEAQSDPVYAEDPDVALPRGGTLIEHMVVKRGLTWPAIAPKPREELAAICR